jgi:hypothetical protein
MRINIEDLWHYQKCPRYYSLQADKTSPGLLKRYTQVSKIYWDILRMSYSHRMAFQKDIPWHFIRNKIGREFPEDHESILSRAIFWWEHIYCKDDRIGLVDLEATVSTGTSYITDEIPLVLVSKEKNSTLVVLVSETLPSEILYNDFVLRSYLWLASNYLSSIIKDVELIDFSHGSPSLSKIRIQKGHDSMDGHIRHITESLERNLIYPSQTIMCQQCKFKTDCWL